jgi:hypothetical protein
MLDAEEAEAEAERGWGGGGVGTLHDAKRRGPRTRCWFLIAPKAGAHVRGGHLRKKELYL